MNKAGGTLSAEIDFSQKEQNAPMAMRLDGLHVLLVDDSADNQRLFHRVLTTAGAIVRVAGDGASAVEWQAREHFDAIVMDIRMPILDGYEASRRIRAQGYGGPIIALTAHANPGEEERCRGSGCSHFYLKPIDRRSLVSAVGKAAQAF